MDSIEKIGKICADIIELTDEDLQAVLDMANEQRSYINPLKLAKQKEFNDLGEYNFNVCNKLIELRKLIQNGAPDNRPSDIDQKPYDNIII